MSTADFSWQAAQLTEAIQCCHSIFADVAQEFRIVALEQRRPFMLLRPTLSLDGNVWVALYGENLMEGVSGFGDTPEAAAHAFDLAWLNMTKEHNHWEMHSKTANQSGAGPGKERG